MNKMNPEIKAKWVAALRSGKYKQGQGCLRNMRNQYCCLGVLCDVVDPNKWEPHKNGFQYRWGRSRSWLPSSISESTGISVVGEYLKQNGEKLDLAFLNDTRHSFKEIADLIEEHL